VWTWAEDITLVRKILENVKGTVAQDYFESFFFSNQTVPPGAIRGYLEPFLLLAIFHGVIPVLTL